MSLCQVHLVGKGMSQRAVRYKVLTMPEVDSATKSADKLLTKESTVAEYNSNVEKMCLEMMIRQVSEPCTPEDLHKAKWKKVDAQELNMNWATYFGVKDTSVIKMIHQNEHLVSKADVDAIMEKKVDVLED